MNFEVMQSDGAVIIRVLREVLDLTVANEFTQALDRDQNTAGALLVDLGRVNYLDSVIISVLVKRYVALRQAGRRLILFGMQDYVEELLRSTGLLQVMDVCSTLERAVKLSGKPLDEEEIARYCKSDNE